MAEWLPDVPASLLIFFFRNTNLESGVYHGYEIPNANIYHLMCSFLFIGSFNTIELLTSAFHLY